MIVTYQQPNRNKLLAFCFTLPRRRENGLAHSCKKETWNRRHGCTLSSLFLLMDGLTFSNDQAKCCNVTCIFLSAINLTCVDDSVSQSLRVDNHSTSRYAFTVTCASVKPSHNEARSAMCRNVRLARSAKRNPCTSARFGHP